MLPNLGTEFHPWYLHDGRRESVLVDCAHMSAPQYSEEKVLGEVNSLQLSLLVLLHGISIAPSCESAYSGASSVNLGK